MNEQLNRIYLITSQKNKKFSFFVDIEIGILYNNYCRR